MSRVTTTKSPSSASAKRRSDRDLEATLRLIPGYDPFATAGDCWFDRDAAREAIDFFAAYLVHVKGEKAGEPFVLEPWQQAIVANLFGWKRPDGARRYREALIFVARKSGKSLLAAGIALYMLFMDGEQGAEIYTAAAERDQAALVFDVAKQQVLRSPELSAACQVFRKAITVERMGSVLKAISAEADTKHGYNSHCVIVDELHAQRTRELVDVLVTSTGARRQPLVVHITTSDYEREGSICNQIHKYASDIRDGLIEGRSFLPVIYEASRDDDWTDPAVWKKANPNLGVSISAEYLETECKKAQDSPAYENTFKRLHLNIRTEQADRWLVMARWDACAGEVDRVALQGRACYAGLDLSSTTDLSALVLVFPAGESYTVLPYFWIPEDRAVERERRDRVPYLAWARDGFIERTPGEVIDYQFIRRRLKDLADRYKIRKLGIDPWNATQLATQLLEEDGFPVEMFRQGYQTMNSPAKKLYDLHIAGQLAHGGHPVLRWMAANVAIDTDPAENIKPSKKRSFERIDGIVATIMAIGLAMVDVKKQGPYTKDRGLLWV